MRTIIALLFVTIAAASAQTKPQKAKEPKYYTAQEIKVYWYNKMPVPGTMAPGRSKALKARQLFVEDVRAGRYDLLAERTATAQNLKTATAHNDIEKAKLYEASLARIEKSIADEEAKRVALEAARAAEYRDSQLIAALEGIRDQLNIMNSQAQLEQMEKAEKESE